MFGEEIPPPHFMNYIAVDDVNTSMERIKELGGNVMGEAIDIPKTGRMCVVQDPTGATFALITLKYE
jgi:predicted enzyme related to lactoylglutathione lyase